VQGDLDLDAFIEWCSAAAKGSAKIGASTKEDGMWVRIARFEGAQGDSPSRKCASG
jgi:hypothetical protein